MTAIGDLKVRLVLEAPIETDDGAGGVTRSYATVTTLWASVTPATQGWTAGHADVVADALGATVTHLIVIRAGPDVTTRHRFRNGDLVYVVVSFRDQDDGRFLAINAEERRD
jgi:head-tail adaptor